MSLGVAIAAAVLATVRLVPDGVLGQTGSKGAFVDWTSCRSCALDADEIALYDGERRVGGYSVKATAIAAEGEWLVAYVPAMYGIIRFRAEGEGKK